MAHERFRLWRPEPQPTARQPRTIIAKLKDAPEVTAAPARRMRAMTARDGGDESAIGRLVQNQYVERVQPVFDEPPPARAARGVAVRAARVHRPTRSDGLVEIKVGRGTSPKALASHINAMSNVEYAFVPPVRYPFGRKSRASQIDPMESRQWSHNAVRIAQARQLPGFNDAATITVAIADSGIDQNHPDLKHSIDEYKNFLTEGDRDYIGHGTHVAGIIAAGFHNGLGISGLCAARLLSMKVLPHDDDDWNAKSYYQALRYVIGRAQVLNLSLGGEKDQAELDVLRDVIEAGVVVVAAMGNEYEEGNPIEYPAAMKEVCAVGATDQVDEWAEFSNTGRHIDLVAPGVQILSTTPTYKYDEPERNYASWDGTSMAAPHVAAAAALLMAKRPNDTPAQIIRRLKAKADRHPRTKKTDRKYGAGRLNCEALLA